MCEKGFLLLPYDLGAHPRGLCLNEQQNTGECLIEAAADHAHELYVCDADINGRIEREFSIDLVLVCRMAEELCTPGRGPSDKRRGRRVEVPDNDLWRDAEAPCGAQPAVRADQEISLAQPAAEILVWPQRAIRDDDGCLRQAAPDECAALPAAPAESVRR